MLGMTGVGIARVERRGANPDLGRWRPGGASGRDRSARPELLVRLDRLTPKEKEYLKAMADLGPGPHRSGDIAAQLGVRVESVAPRQSGLIAKGMIYSPAHGDTAFTVPLFDEFLARALRRGSS